MAAEKTHKHTNPSNANANADSDSYADPNSNSNSNSNSNPHPHTYPNAPGNDFQPRLPHGRSVGVLLWVGGQHRSAQNGGDVPHPGH